MPPINKISQRGSTSSRRIPIDAIKEVLRDTRIWVGIGIVEARQGSHFEVDEDSGGIFVEVLLLPGEEIMTCRLATTAANPGSGVWHIPKPGTEVMVAIPEGELDEDPVIIATTSSGDLPEELKNDTDSTVIVNTTSNVVINAANKVQLGGDSGLEAAALGVSLEQRIANLENEFLNHAHNYVSGSPAFNGETGTAAQAGTTGKPPQVNTGTTPTTGTPTFQSTKVELK